MRRILWAVVILAALCAGSRVDAAIACSGLTYIPVGYASESITVSTVSIGFTTTKITPAGAQPAIYANCTLESNPIRHREDGLDPTSSVGLLVTAGQNIEVCGQQNIQVVRFIRQGGADGTLQCTYYRF